MPRIVYEREDNSPTAMDQITQGLKAGLGVKNAFQQSQINSTNLEASKLALEQEQAKWDEYNNPLNVETRKNESETKAAQSFTQLLASRGEENLAVGGMISQESRIIREAGLGPQESTNLLSKRFQERTNGRLQVIPLDPIQREDGSQVFKAMVKDKSRGEMEIEYSDTNELLAKLDSAAMNVGYYTKDRVEAAGTSMYAEAIMSSMKPDELKQFGANKDEIMNNPEFAALARSGFYSKKDSTAFMSDLREESRKIAKHESDLDRTDMLNKATMLDIAHKRMLIDEVKSGEAERKILQQVDFDAKRLGLEAKQLESAENTQKYIKDSFSFFQTAPIYDPMDSTKLIGYEPLPLEKQKMLLAIPKIAEGYDPSEPYPARVVAATYKAIEAYDKMQKKGAEEPGPEPGPEPTKRNEPKPDKGDSGLGISGIKFNPDEAATAFHADKTIPRTPDELAAEKARRDSIAEEARRKREEEAARAYRLGTSGFGSGLGRPLGVGVVR